jgi:hypothetical protein
MNVFQIDTKNKLLKRQFINLPFQIYKDISQWVPPLYMDINRVLDHQRHPFYKHSKAAFFMAYDNTETPIGRLAILENKNYNIFNQEKTAFFYLFECINDTHTASELFSAGINWAKSQGLDKIIGPKGFTVFDGIGLLVKGFEHRPAFGLPYNPAYYIDLIEGLEFEPIDDLVSGYLNRQTDFPKNIHAISKKIQERRNLRIAVYKSRKDLRQLIPYLKDMYNDALGGTTGNVPLTDDEVAGLAEQMLWFADPRLIKIIYKEEKPVGFLFAYPDISAAVQRTQGKLFPFGWLDLYLELKRTCWININGGGMIEGYRGLGGTAVLFSEIYKSILDSRYQHAELVQVGVHNLNMQRELRNIGIEFYKTHRLYQKLI